MIEFGDGRQYKVESEAAPTPPKEPTPPPAKQNGPREPPRREERFVDDFDRSWPRSKQSSAHGAGVNGHAKPAAEAVSPIVPVVPMSQDPSRVLFNAQSNKLEPYSKAHQTGSGFLTRRPEILTPDKGPRDQHVAPHQQPSSRTEEHPPSRSQAWGRNQNGPSSAFNSATSPRDRDFGPIGDHRARRPSNASSSAYTQGRQAPPHLNHQQYDSSMPPPPLPAGMWRTPSQDSRSGQRPARGGPPSSSGRSISGRSVSGRSIRPPSPSPSQSPTSSLSKHAILDLQDPANLPDLNEMRKDLMQNAAARAKQRREQEEQEREKERVRAQQKAAEIAVRIDAAAAAKEKEAAEKVSHLKAQKCLYLTVQLFDREMQKLFL